MLTDLWFLVIRVGDLLPLVPVLRLFGFGVLNSFGRQEVPVIFQIARLDFLIVNLDLIRVVRVDNQCVQMSVLIILQGIQEMCSVHQWIYISSTGAYQFLDANENYFGIREKLVFSMKGSSILLMSHLASNVLVDKMVLAFVVEDDVNLLCAGATNVRT